MDEESEDLQITPREYLQWAKDESFLPLSWEGLALPRAVWQLLWSPLFTSN